MPESSREVQPAGILLCDDMIFSSRITGTARALGLTLRVARSADALIELAKESAPTGCIIDLANSGLSIDDLMRRLRGLGPRMPRVVGYGSHVDTETLRAAREAGCDQVLPRSKFVEELPRSLREWLKS